MSLQSGIILNHSMLVKDESGAMGQTTPRCQCTLLHSNEQWSSKEKTRGPNIDQTTYFITWYEQLF